MSVRVNEGFIVLAEKLNISANQSHNITTRRDEVKKIIEKGFETFGTPLQGAYVCNTLVAPLKDNTIDLYILLNYQRYRNHEPNDLVTMLNTHLCKNISETYVNPKNKRVTISYPEFTFNLVPGFIMEDEGYLIPDSHNEHWVLSRPIVHREQLKKSNKKHDKLLLPVIKMIKYWNRKNGDYFNEYYIELFVQEMLTNFTIISYASAVQHIFKNGVQKVVFIIDDPAEPSQVINGLRNLADLAKGMLALNKAFVTTTSAERFGKKGDIKLAFREWASIFPDLFPTLLQMEIQALKESGVDGADALKKLRDKRLF